MPDKLEYLRWKLWRAHEHIQAVQDTAHSFLRSGFYRLVLKQDRQGRLVAKFGDVDPMPPLVNLLIGDAAHNLRSALDHLMFLLARPSPGKERDVFFPLMKSRKYFANTAQRMPGVARGVRTLVERLQPYHRRKWPQTELLRQIDIIDKWDKHRSLLTTAAALADSRLNLVITGKTTLLREEKFRGPLKAGTVIARLEMGYSEVGAEVKMNPVFTLQPIFDDRMPEPIRRRPVISTLGKAGDFIENEVLPMFKRFL